MKNWPESGIILTNACLPIKFCTGHCLYEVINLSTECIFKLMMCRWWMRIMRKSPSRGFCLDLVPLNIINSIINFLFQFYINNSEIPG